MNYILEVFYVNSKIIVINIFKKIDVMMENFTRELVSQLLDLLSYKVWDLENVSREKEVQNVRLILSSFLNSRILFPQVLADFIVLNSICLPSIVRMLKVQNCFLQDL